MTDAQHAAFSGYLRGLANQLLLADWEITLERTRSAHTNNAEAHTFSTRNELIVRFNSEFFGYAGERQRRYCVHELLHAHTARYHKVIERLTEQHDDQPTVAFAKTTLDDEHEIITERLARILAPHLPLPPTIGE